MDRPATFIETRETRETGTNYSTIAIIVIVVIVLWYLWSQRNPICNRIMSRQESSESFGNDAAECHKYHNDEFKCLFNGCSFGGRRDEQGRWIEGCEPSDTTYYRDPAMIRQNTFQREDNSELCSKYNDDADKCMSDSRCAYGRQRNNQGRMVQGCFEAPRIITD